MFDSHFRHKRKESGLQRNPLFLYTRVHAFLITIACRACGGRICNATERSLERRRRARLPLSGTVLLQKRNMKRNRRTEIASGGRYEE